ncbi:PREDICTED: uncharacterized protein At2g39795, mitochondrial [Tarenaya hassleriana]|uniref:uncharacterized protein At2g39795, mitochondrial n=1 Tax=Tarenaya hassleriana TaxID=28532 RepID=UPI00053C1D4B|nr:PREDICTED: uncharacterized protein At2g39795, mitochondrial [Tarenaya hassleriana]
MATFASKLRRAAVCLAGARRNYHSTLLSAVDHSPAFVGRQRSPAPSSSPIFRFTTALKGASSDDLLLRVLESEIECTEQTDDYDRVDETPSGFPFQMEDKPGGQTITLTREYQGESVKVEVHMSNLVTGVNEDDEEEESDDDDEGEDGERPEKPRQSSVPIFVTFSKKTGPSLEFRCTALPDKISIKDMSVRYLDNTSKDQSAYEGPSFRDFDEKLRKAFHRYIENRGIKPSMLNFLHEYMINKDSREYLLWLKSLKNFVQS